MSAATVPFQEIVDGVLFRIANDKPTPLVLAKIAEFANSAEITARHYFEWPDALRIEEETVLEHPTAAGAHYVPRVTAARSYQQLLEIYSSDPRSICDPGTVSYRVLADGFYIFQPLGTVWVKATTAPNKYTSVPYDAAKAYTVGASVMATDGHNYRCIQAGTGQEPSVSPTYWAQVPVMACLAEALKAGATGAILQGNGQHGTGRVKLEYMKELLDDAIEQIHKEAGSANYRTR